MNDTRSTALAISIIPALIVLSLLPQFDHYSNSILTTGLEILFCSFYYLIKKEDLQITKKQICYFLLFALCISIPLLMAYFDHRWHHHKLIRHFQILLLVPFTFCFSKILVNSRKIGSYILTTLLAIGFIMFSYQLKQLISSNLSGEHYIYRCRFFEHQRHSAHFFAACCAISTAFLLGKKSSISMLITLWISLASTWSILLWMGGRMSIVASVFTTFTIITLYLLHKKNRLKAIVIPTSAFSAGFLGSLLMSQYTANNFGISSMADRTAKATEAAQLGSGRDLMWQTALDIFEKNIWLGQGADAYANDAAAYGLHPHNIFLQYLSEFGIIGCLFIFPSIAVLLYKTMRPFLSKLPTNQSIVAFAAGSAAVNLLIISLTSGSYYFSLPVFLLCLFFGMMIANKNSEKKS